MAELWLICEGEPGSVDVALLKAIFTDVLAAEIIVKAGSGERGLGPIVRYLNKQDGARAAYVLDRDYLPRDKADASMTDGRPGFFWRRHSIENYLLPPPVILRAFQGLREQFQQKSASGRIPAWVATLPDDSGEVAEALRGCSRRKAAEEACRMATHRLWESLPSTIGRPQRRIPRRVGSEDPNDWREALCLEADRVCQSAADTAACEHFRREAVSTLFDIAHAEITAESYIRDLEFLVDFHGKDLLGAFHQWLASRKIPLSRPRLGNVLIPAAVDAYREDRTIYGRDDFRDVANGVRALAGLPDLS